MMIANILPAIVPSFTHIPPFPHSSQARQTAPIDGHTAGPIQQVVVHVAFGVILGRA